MDNTSSFTSVCTRCGKKRIISKTWKETIFLYGTETVITHEEAVCPDPECQKEVDSKLLKEKEQREEIRKGVEKRLHGKKKH